MIEEKYQWAVDRLKEAFPEAQVETKVQDYGRGLVLLVQFPALHRTWAAVACGFKTTGGVMQWMSMVDDEDEEYSGEMEWRLGPPFTQETQEITPSGLEQWIETLSAHCSQGHYN